MSAEESLSGEQGHLCVVSDPAESAICRSEPGNPIRAMHTAYFFQGLELNTGPQRISQGATEKHPPHAVGLREHLARAWSAPPPLPPPQARLARAATSSVAALESWLPLEPPWPRPAATRSPSWGSTLVQ